ncbi:MAG: imidazole glycerol phosphate synthase, glutamine amidotransferase subunit [Candidatus Magasanikbacteria bacterium RIFCSPLOWO2_01_FULL_43_20b]|uniref:Imidazole glycerol phosphate synthase subunit HisH n=1 Tax=Candidatus Magasanikbacteria bacterium RIFCSPLOWO2_12_FULL_43_12 TaxID=1798692 RepID=A0A1F6MRZ5_9BACT|nr:MAG: imidazole glycerol phosphate synthase, glutamine amidotransferase subunit [Candidatus Magasanikbacteria bacterium RIFCSPHIGHO2_02_FULL_44_13]OGH72572.1 MAG: imidazole glycerol phosphate synthase, glutamine amidotransferase subunit [Candidatus Magasanikbacteria bacterium RIFCSPLOWO2_02_FULL_43_22]OGH73311.1 MAG: imidazole glycerol phosphate synthase, glutamine amidotransferase subunit [Candidatus Magasanikbacteria bacterium RIFCSPLOWO2_01_FULL_43_20b]OGH74318.1 MAG: imidazole glycerol pho
MIAVIDYGMGNLASIKKALEYAGGKPFLTSNPQDLERAERIVLPGVGAFAEGMSHLKESGMDVKLREAVLKGKKPLFGICLGMQLLAKKSYEFGEYPGLGLIDAEVKKFDFYDTFPNLRVPHVGWNAVGFKIASPYFEGIKDNSDFYFVHSYHVVCREPRLVAAVSDYGGEFTAAIAKDNIFATQFHPEKSQQYGLKMLENFVAL